MRTRTLALSVAVTLSIVSAARPSAQSSPIGDLIQKAKGKLAKPKVVECAADDQACIDAARKAGAQVKVIDPRAPAATTPQPPAQAPPAPSTANQSSATGFDVPEPDYASLFKLFIAANSDVLGDDKAAAWEHYLLFRIPPNAPRPGSGVLLSPECMDLQVKLHNELTAETVLNAARANFKQALAAMQSGGKSAVFRLRTKERLAAYDTSKGVFPLEAINSTMLSRSPKFRIDRAGIGGSPTSYIGASTHSWCSPTPPTPVWLNPSIWTSSDFELEISGHEGLNELPMERAAAEAYLNANPQRVVDLDVVVDVGTAGMKTTLPARILAARLVNPPDRRVLHTYAVGGTRMTTTSGGGAAPSSASTDGAVLFTAKRGFLLTMRDQPARMTQSALIYATRNQVGTEQMVWKQVELLQNSNNPAGIPRNRWNPKRPIFTYEWQNIIERQPDIARGPLLDTFLRPDPDWSFVTRDPAWDARFEALVVTTMFARDKVVGRDPSFAAEELAPIYKQHLDLAASKAPTELWIPMTLPPFTYDFAAHALRFPPRTNYGGKPSTIGGTDMLPVVISDPRGLLEYVLPPGSRNLATYEVREFLSAMQRAERASAPTSVGINLGAQAATEAWRHATTIGSSYRDVPAVEVLAFDRQVQVTTIPMETARAEALAKRVTANPSSRLTARVYFHADRVEIGERIYDDVRSPTAVLVGKVNKVEILDFDDAVIATVSTTELPAPAVTTAPTAPAARPPAPAATATPRPPTAAEAEAERQRRIAENLQKMSEANRKNIQKDQEVLDAMEKDKKCRAEAAKVNTNPQSKAYQDAYTACRTAK